MKLFEAITLPGAIMYSAFQPKGNEAKDVNFIFGLMANGAFLTLVVVLYFAVFKKTKNYWIYVFILYAVLLASGALYHRQYDEKAPKVENQNSQPAQNGQVQSGNTTTTQNRSKVSEIQVIPPRKSPR